MRRDLFPLVRDALADSYVVEREIGRGGVARVFLARDKDGTEVALKVLRPELTVSLMADRFLREIHLVSSLNHPRIAPVKAWGQRDWLLYYAMPFVQGPTLARRLADGPLAPDEAIRLGAELLDALAHAHAHGIVHRDVKPDNIVLSPDGAVLLDFGIARAVAVAGTDALTQSGMAVGTCAYMSPEQITAEDIDQRADLYAVGCVLFECLTGSPPFKHPNDNVTLQMHLNSDAPDVRVRNASTPAPLAGAIARALRKSSRERWQTAEAMRAALLGDTGGAH